MQTIANTNLSSLQLELLKIFSFEPSEKELIEVRKMLADFFMIELQNKINISIEEQNITENEIDSWLYNEN